MVNNIAIDILKQLKEITEALRIIGKDKIELQEKIKSLQAEVKSLEFDVELYHWRSDHG